MSRVRSPSPAPSFFTLQRSRALLSQSIKRLDSRGCACYFPLAWGVWGKIGVYARPCLARIKIFQVSPSASLQTFAHGGRLPTRHARTRSGGVNEPSGISTCIRSLFILPYDHNASLRSCLRRPEHGWFDITSSHATAHNRGRECDISQAANRSYAFRVIKALASTGQCIRR
jgi:hypothetical protein